MRSIRVLGLLAASVLLAGCNVFWGQFGGEQSHQSNNTGEIAFGVSTPGGNRDLIFLTTKTGTLAARDLHTGASVWSIGFPAGTCKINNGSTTCYTTSSPAIDQANGFVYTYGLDG